MFERIVTIGLLVAGFGLGSPAWAAQNNLDASAQNQGSIPTAPSDSQNATSDQEHSGPLTSTDRIVDHFMQLDTDKSNSVSFDEYMTMVQQRAKDRFNAMDANHDGQVTPDEYRQFWLSRMAQWYRLKR